MIAALRFLLAELLFDALDLFWHIGMRDYCPCEHCADRHSKEIPIMIEEWLETLLLAAVMRQWHLAKGDAVALRQIAPAGGWCLARRRDICSQMIERMYQEDMIRAWAS